MSDPKAIHAEKKPQLHLNPAAGSEAQARALELGASKYGAFNWRRNKVNLTTYLSAMKRHIDQIMDGQDLDDESGVHHLGHVMAGCGIVLDAMRHGTLVDDRVNPQNQQ